MNTRDIRIAIAESIGWRHREGGMWYHPDISTVPETLIPNYCNDLNAMHEIEIAIVPSKWIDYEYYLGLAIEKIHGKAYLEYYISATALQRAEAYLRTIGKWNEK